MRTSYKSSAGDNCQSLPIFSSIWNYATSISKLTYWKDWKPDVARKVPHFANFDLLTPHQRLAQMLTIMRDIVNGVAFIHRNNEVHRDLKPRNGTYSAKKFSAANG